MSNNVDPLPGYFRVADFVHTCCHRSPDGDTVCDDITHNYWINVLMTVIRVMQLLLFLFSPYFIPKSLYSKECSATQYVCYPETASQNAGGTHAEEEFKTTVLFTKDSKSDQKVLALQEKNKDKVINFCP